MAPDPHPRRRSTRDCVRIARECGFRWALDNVVVDPAVPPDRDLVTLTLTDAEADAALTLTPEAWWQAWAAGWVAGSDAHHRTRPPAPPAGED